MLFDLRTLLFTLRTER